MKKAEDLHIYRKRYFPPENILLKDDIVVQQTEDYVLTKWKTLKPKAAFSHGCSCYYLKQGFKVSKYFRTDGSLLYWYCDIVDYEWNEERTKLVVTDLLADVILYPDGKLRVLDLDELAEAFERGLLSPEKMVVCMQRLNHLLEYIYKDRFDRLQSCLDGVPGGR